MASRVVKYVNICHCSSDPTVRGQMSETETAPEKLMKSIFKESYVCSVRNLPPSLALTELHPQYHITEQWQN